MKHVFESHSYTPDFRFKCELFGCTQTFRTYAAYASHLSRRHFCDLNQVQPATDNEQDNIDPNDDEMDMQSSFSQQYGVSGQASQTRGISVQHTTAGWYHCDHRRRKSPFLRHSIVDAW